MAGITKKDIEYVANLARLPLTDSEIETYSYQLESVVNYFKELNEVDTSNVEPTHQTTGLLDVVREDKIDSTRVLNVEAAVSQAEKVYNNLFVVPRLINQE